MYYVRFKTSLLIQLVTCFYCSYSTGNPFSSLLINDVTQLFLELSSTDFALELSRTGLKPHLLLMIFNFPQ